MYFNVHTLRYTRQQKLHNWVCSKTTRCYLLHGAFQIFVLTAGGKRSRCQFNEFYGHPETKLSLRHLVTRGQVSVCGRG